MCECEKELALTFLPHQTKIGTEYGTQDQYPVDGFALNICPECRGQNEEAHPRQGRLGKIQRFYWREIYKTYLSLASDFLKHEKKQVKEIIEFERRFKATSKKLKKTARKVWQDKHKIDPKYDTTEITESKFLSNIIIPEIEISAGYIQIEKGTQKKGKWISNTGEKVSVEKIASEHFENIGYEVHICEGKLISSIIGTLCSAVIQDPEDPKNRIAMRGSSKNWIKKNSKVKMIVFSLPQDFGSQEYFKRRKTAFSLLFSELRQINDLNLRFDENLESSVSLRDYLWVNDRHSVELTRRALMIIPKDIIVDCLEWAIQHFWDRRSGWPDLLLMKKNQYKFVEVKSPLDKLSLNQMKWFEWALKNEISCVLCRIKK